MNSHQRQAHQLTMMRLINAIIRESLVPNNWQIEVKNDTCTIKDSQKKLQLILGIQHHGAFQRFQFRSPIQLLYHTKKEKKMNTLDELINFLRHDMQLEIPINLEQELYNSVENLAFAYDAWEQRRKRYVGTLKPKINLTEIDTVLNLVEEIDLYLFSEQVAFEGNPLHPCAKTRIGVSDEERQLYSPELNREVMLKMILIPKQHVHVTSFLSTELNNFFEKHAPGLLKLANQVLQSKQKKLSNYQLIPVHPWQYDHMIKEKSLSNELEWFLVPAVIPANPLLSFRTMDTSGKFHLKLPVRIQITNAIRSLSPQTTVNGPILTQQINQLLAKKPQYAKHLMLLPELAGAYYQPNQSHTNDWSSQLSFTIRTHPNHLIHNHEQCLVGASLTANNPFTDRPLIIDLIEQWCGNKIEQSYAIQYVEDYAKKCLPPFLYLLQKFGTALEGHMQNSIIVVENGEIKRIMIRDMGGVRINQTRFTKDIQLPLYESDIFVQGMDSVYNKFLHSVIQNHFGDLIFTIAQYLRISENSFWKVVSHTLRSSIDMNIPEAEKDLQSLLRSKIKTKALLTMRQKEQHPQKYLYTEQINPLVGDYT
ncbi:Siderophore synthetase component [Seinonella peptonophila]|uniref:Siderophore synthetase component n=1 Tax=Seinonella peptonophila TaxID=112248 RepID=A0A1M5BCR4_9BACL|nr:IucA/IucC family protein [Seinonella peptonophila]SHF40176.1 Siderophore synthetase component [Seinonella peptonophila]